MPRSHKVVRVQGGRLVNAAPRAEVEQILDAASVEGFDVVTSFVVDENVYLVLGREA
ncbi:MAG: hypothetical protein M0040_04280 [Actinomycetota bacterium]|nr:hypothetical protein [Actinomycetota bacterium]